MTEVIDNATQHTYAHAAWKSTIIRDPNTNKVLGMVDTDRLHFNLFKIDDTHADICLRDYINRSLDKCSQCQMYAVLCLKDTDVGPRESVRADNIRRLKKRI